MAHISGHDRSQTLLFPEAIDDYVGSDNPVRFIDAFVDGLDLAAAGFAGIEAKPTGRPGYAHVFGRGFWADLEVHPALAAAIQRVPAQLRRSLT